MARSLPLSLCAVALYTVLFIPTLQPARADAPAAVVKQASWQETMLATRANVGAWLAEQERNLRSLKLGPWYTTGPLKVKGFGDAQFPEKGIDLGAKGPNGKPAWQKTDYKDGEVHHLPAQDAASTYLYRTIAADKDFMVAAFFGSDDGLAVWLNGKRLIANDVPRGVGPDQDRADLNLVAGENRLLIKIHNQTGDHGFYFSLQRGLPQQMWQQIQQAFPVETGWMMRDIPRQGYLAWLRSGDSTDMEKAMIGKVLGDIGAAGDGVRKELDALVQSKATPSDRRWLDLYVKACRFRNGLVRVNQVNLKALRLAIEDLAKTYPDKYAKGPEFLGRLAACEKLVAEITQALARGDESMLNRVDDAIALQREALLANPLLDFDELLVLRRRTNNLGLPQNWQGNCAVSRTGYDNEIATLSPVGPNGKLNTFFRPKSTEFVGDVDLNFDADKMLFTMPGSHGRFQIWEIKADRSGLRQVTPGEEPDVDNYDACYLPDGRVLFDSTRCFQGIPCVGGGNTVANLCIMDADGKNARQLCFDQDHNWCPTVMNNGRVLYTRWEYSDTPHYFSRLLFTMNPDGTEQMAYYHSNSFWPNSTFYARPIPNHPTQIVAIISGHHGVPRMGELILFDPAKGRADAEGAVQRIPGYGKKVEPIIMDTLVDGVWPKFLHPYPLSDKYFITTCQPTPGSLWGVYLVDVFDNMLLLKEEPGYALFEPVPFRKTPKPPVVPDRVKLDRRDAVVYLSDIYMGAGLAGVPRGTVKRLRIFEYHYTYPEMGGHINVGIEGPWDVHRILGTVPVLEDGSAVFRVPANTPLAVQPIDAEGQAVQIMRSWFTAMPGEVLSCVGCHEKRNSAPPSRKTLAATQKPAEIEPWYGPTRGFSFKRDVQQPVLDKYCVGCHNGQARPDGKKIPDLTAKPRNGWGNFTPSYIALHPYVRRPGPESDYYLQIPLEFHVNTSELFQMLAKGHHGVKLDAEAWDRLATWVDLNVPDHGTWTEHRPIPKNYHQRRIEMRTKYANRPEDPELIPDIKRDPVTFVEPQPVAKPELPKPAISGWPFDVTEAKKRQAAGGPKTEVNLDLGNGIALTLVYVPAGEFVMGDPAGEIDETPPACVKIEKPFYMGKFEVTADQFRQFDPRHKNGFFDQHHKDHTTPGYPADGPNKPVIRVSWKQAMAFCQWLSARTGRSFTLPTEAQWEWACRAGSATPMFYGDLDTDFAKFANLADLSIKLLAVDGINPQPIANPSPYQDFLPKEPRFNDGNKLMAEVGKYQPNAWGLHDMHGNVWEWTRTTYAAYPYRETDGRNDLREDADKVVRGGSFYDRPKRARSAFRLSYRPYQGVWNVGFRVICEAGPAEVAVKKESR